VSETKERILNESLVLFSVKGYDGVSMSDIAGAVGIKASSIYKHYVGKEEIFRSIVRQFEDKTASIFNSTLLEDREYKNISKEMLIEMIRQTFILYAEDPFLANCRKLFMISAFKRPEIGSLYTKYFIEMPIQYQAKLFTILQEDMEIHKRDTKVMAYHFYTPILIILQEFDYKKITVEEALEKINVLVTQFMEVYQL
jgi:AcrR family transcriptional regulator